jgi:hypothetical protein
VGAAGVEAGFDVPQTLAPGELGESQTDELTPARHLIEDTFNTQKNNGIGLEHVFCAQATASKNYYTMMQVAQVLWIITCRGCLQRLYDWARRATGQGLARALWEGLRAARLPLDLPPLGQIRFGFT